jgi:N-acetylglutamate synthase-like GNAT family acetyltransferase
MYSVLGTGLDEKLVVEINALIVSESHRNNGFGDSMLDYMEQDLRRKNVGLVVIVPTTGSCDWFVDRGFEYQGLANHSMVLPEERRHGYKEFAKLYSKSIVDIDSSLADLPAGRRIGF